MLGRKAVTSLFKSQRQKEKNLEGNFIAGAFLVVRHARYVVGAVPAELGEGERVVPV